jgi:crossover junction endodeoxyribonuclease RuvC
MIALRVIGLDPGLRRTGWGVISVEGSRLSFVACGVVKSDERQSLAQRLKELHEGLARIITEHRPGEAAVEETFVSKDARATLKLGHARGIALLVPAQLGLPVAEYAANLIKKTVVGAGHAEKHQVEAMIRLLLPKADPRVADAADALAVAITHAHHRGGIGR